MTDRDIHDAFERMRPSQAAKDRMLENILSSAPLLEKRRKRRGWKTSLLLAAAIAAGLSVAAAAYGTDFFGLWSVGMRDREIFSPVEVEEGIFVPGTAVVDEVSMQGLTDSPEYQAAMEWEDFCSAYDPDGAILADAEGYVPPPDYEAYLCYSQEMMDQLDRLCEKYHLELLGPSTGAFEEWELFNGAGSGNVCSGSLETGRNYMSWGYYYAGGSYFFEGRFVWTDTDGRSADYQFNCAAKGYLSTVSLNVGSLDDYEQWEYTTADGVPLLLALGPSKALILADTEESFVTVNVLGDWAMGTFDISREDLEEIAEGFHFSVVP